MESRDDSVPCLTYAAKSNTHQLFFILNCAIEHHTFFAFNI